VYLLELIMHKCEVWYSAWCGVARVEGCCAAYGAQLLADRGRVSDAMSLHFCLLLWWSTRGGVGLRLLLVPSCCCCSVHLCRVCLGKLHCRCHVTSRAANTIFAAPCFCTICCCRMGPAKLQFPCHLYYFSPY
jgi:hypothetical protein